MTPQQTPDIIALLIFLGALIFGPELAAVVGPYVAIIVAAALGLREPWRYGPNGLYNVLCTHKEASA